MIDDPIIEELHRIREEMAAKFNYDVHAMFADIQAQQAKEDRPVVSFAKERKEYLAEELEAQDLAA